jgi:mRNA interferase MazF
MISQRDIILIEYPFSDMEGSKIRPALVISNDVCNSASSDFIALPLTSIIKDEPYSIIITSKDLYFGNLDKPSRIRANKMLCLEKNLVLGRIGILREEVFEEVRDSVVSVF